MKSEARLDSAVFQLTPTRTRCDLVITANGKTEKLASGLLNPFLAHLKAAQDQIAKGGYSITLEPDPSIDAFWFTKGIIERFVRFVSTPEVLERVTTIESEILQIEEALSIQGNENLGLSTVEDHQTKSAEYIEGSKPVFDADAEKAIVLYKLQPGSLPFDSNGSATQEENSKVQLLRVLETRKIVLQKEQGMAFARATAAGFDMDHMTHLITFADAFGASRMKDACLRFMELWRVKHETGQWFEVEAAEAMSMRSGFSPFNASGIVLAGDMRSAGGDLSVESNGNDVTADHDKDKRFPSDPQVFHSQSQQPAYPPWAMHPPPGAFQPYPMPYYQNYPANGPFYPPPYPPAEDPRFNAHQRSGMRRHSMNSKDNDIDSELEDAIDQSLSDFERESSHGRKSQRRVGRSGKKKNGVVVIKNLNYIASKKHGASDGESQSASDTETEGESESSRSDAAERKHKKSSRSSKKYGDDKRSSETSNGYDMDAMVKGNDADSGNWQAFQSFLLRAEEKTTSTADGDMFAGEKEPASKKRQNVGEAEPIFTPERDSGDNHEARLMEFDSISGKTSRARQVASNDEMLASSERSLGGSHSDAQFVEVVGGGGGYRRTATDDFMIYGQETQISKRFSDPLAEAAEHEYKQSGDLEKSSYVVTDESFLVPFRSGSQDQFETDNRTALDMDLEFPSSSLRKEDNDSNVKAQVIYEPDDLAMMPERAIESDYSGYDPAIDYEMQIPLEIAVNQDTVEQEDVPASTDKLKTSDKEKKLNCPKDGLEKRKKDAMMRRGPPSKSVPLTEAQKRAEKLRAYKVDLQREKKANEEEARKRLEALKLERQKRIAARSGSTATQSPAAAKQTQPGFPAKVSPSSFKGSKSTDPDSGSNSSPRKMPKKSSSIGNNDSKTTKTTTFNGSMNGVTKSVSSLTELKKDSNGTMPEVNAAAARRRLSDPNVRNVQNASKKPESMDQIPKRNITNAPQMKVSAITQLDKTRSATLPELKAKVPRGPSETAQIKLVTKEKQQKESGSSSNQGSGSFPNEKPPSISNSDENPVIEKTVVMLENEMVTGSAIRADDSKKGDADEKTEPDSEYAAIRAPPSPVIKDEVEVPNQRKPVDQVDYYEVVDNSPKTEPRNVSNYVTENLYQAPHARASSMEDAAASSLEYTGAQAVHGSETTSVHGESIKAHVANFSPDSNLTDQDHESFEKPRSKESKGFRKLLKFGRKTHSSASGEVAIDSDGSVVDDRTESGSSNDVHILKNLIPQDDAHAGGTPTKVHRPFSILSPFRSSKSSEKKLAA